MMTSNSTLNSEGSRHRHISGAVNKMSYRLIGQEKMMPRESIIAMPRYKLQPLLLSLMQ